MYHALAARMTPKLDARSSNSYKRRWTGAHPVVRLHIQEQRGDHGHRLLACDAAAVILPLHELVHLPTIWLRC